MTVRLHRGDLPDLSRYTASVAIDTETMGLHPHRDRLCVVQLSNGDGSADVVQIPKDHGKGRRRAEPEGAAGQSEGDQNLSFRAVRSRRALQRLRRDAAAGLLHQDRLAAVPHLHRSPRPEGSGARGAQHRPVEAAAIERLGRLEPERGAACAMRPPTCCICTACANGSMPCWPAKAALELAQACFEFLPTRAKLDLQGWDTEDIFRPFCKRFAGAAITAPLPRACRPVSVTLGNAEVRPCIIRQDRVEWLHHASASEQR